MRKGQALRPALLSKQLFDILRQRLRLVRRRVTLHHLTIPVNQKLGEVPFHRLAPQQTGSFFLEVTVQRVGIVTIDIDLAEQRKIDAKVQLAELTDGRLITRP